MPVRAIVARFRQSHLGPTLPTLPTFTKWPSAPNRGCSLGKTGRADLIFSPLKVDRTRTGATAYGKLFRTNGERCRMTLVERFLDEVRRCWAIDCCMARPCLPDC